MRCVRRLGCRLLAVSLALSGVARASLHVELDAHGLSDTEIAASQRLVAAALAALPPSWRDAPGHVVLRWRDDLPGHVHGRARGGRVGLQRGLLDGSKAGDPVAADDAALAALLHELAHLHDRSPRGGLSRDPRLLDLAGWPAMPLRFGLRGARNDHRDRSPDRYELSSPAEFVAVNLEHFLLDPQYACRRPALHAYFTAHLDWSPPRAGCAPGLAYVSADAAGGIAELLELDPRRVFAVDYLLAEGNARPMSRWGHSMLRLVVCAPGRPPGPDCRMDLDHHRVLSFRAFVDDVQISNWKGLAGSYPSRLFVLPLEQVVDEYTKVELRALRSVPLRLSREEIDGLLDRAAQLHWSYDGRYYFVGNNCAVETWRLLHDGVPRLAHAPLRSITPTGLLRRLEREGVADAEVLADHGQALRRGYRFESLAAYFDAMFEVADAALELPYRDAQAWLAAAPEARAPWLQRADLRAAAALLLLEQAALRREELLARDDLKRRFLRQGAGSDDAAVALVVQLRELLRDAAYAGRPASLLAEGGYGLPQEGERERLRREVAGRGERMTLSGDRLVAEARALLPAERGRRLDGIEANLARLGDRLRALDAASGSGPGMR